MLQHVLCCAILTVGAKPKCNFQVSIKIHSSYWKVLCLLLCMYWGNFQASNKSIIAKNFKILSKKERRMCQSLGGGVGGGELREFRSTPKQKLGGQSPDFHGCIWQIQMTYMTSELVIFCPEKTEELPRRSTMKQVRLNNCCLMHCHKLITNTLYTVKIACANKQCKGHFGKIE